MAVAGSSWRGGLLAVVTGVALAGLMAAPGAAQAARTSGAAGATAAAADATAGASQAGRPEFIARPGVRPAGSKLAQVCPTPVNAGQMTCMALLPTKSAGLRADSSPPAGAYDPAVLREAYNVTTQATTPPAGGTDTVAIVDAYNDPHAATDLAVYRTTYGLPACTVAAGCLKVVSQTGTATLPRGDSTGGWELEESLDLDMVSAFCPYCRILLVEAKSDSISALATAEHYAVRHAKAVSNSWGSGAEFLGEKTYDSDFYRPGVAITAAAGDDGYGTQYPAVSPYVTAVGGTALHGATATTPGTQSTWNDTGSGCSALEPQQTWQTSDPGFPTGCKRRTSNDLAVIADPDPGVAVYDTVPYGGDDASTAPDWAAVGGTSVGAPLIAAAYALADISTGKPGSGLVPGTLPVTYPYANRRDFTDITTGDDGSCAASRRYLCHAEIGYDGPTGLGTPIGLAGLLGPAKPTVTVIDPGTQTHKEGSKVTLRLRSLNSGSAAVAYSAAGLPRGLRLRDGVIEGKLTKKLATYKVTVHGRADGARGSAVFEFIVKRK
jgi:hypothetical protein